MKTLSIAMALALTSGAAQAGSVFEVPINGGIARILLDDNCQESICASVSWTENDRYQDRKERYRKEPAKPTVRLKRAPAANLTSSDPTPPSGSTAGPGVSSGATSAPAPATIGAGPAGSGSNAEPPAMASREPAANVAPPAPVLEPNAVAAIAPPQAAVSAIEASETSPVGEWLVEDGEASIRIEECGNNLCGVVSGAKNWNATDSRKSQS